jgi:hypothetical protein
MAVGPATQRAGWRAPTIGWIGDETEVDGVRMHGKESQAARLSRWGNIGRQWTRSRASIDPEVPDQQ